MIKTFPKTGIPQALVDAVANYLAARVFAEVTREEVDKIAAPIVERMEFYTSEKWAERFNGQERITSPRELYLCADDDKLQAYYAECDKAERAAGIKPPDMPSEYCPALVAEHEQVKAEWALIDAAAVFLEMDDPLDFKKHLFGEKRQQFIDLNASMVLSYEGE